MNNIILMGRLTKDPMTRYGTENKKTVTRYSLAVERKSSKDTVDFIDIVAFDKQGEFADKYFHKGLRVLVRGRLQSDTYTAKDGQKVKTFQVIAEDQEFADGKMSQERPDEGPAKKEYMDVPDMSGEELPWNRPKDN